MAGLFFSFQKQQEELHEVEGERDRNKKSGSENNPHINTNNNNFINQLTEAKA